MHVVVVEGYCSVCSVLTQRVTFIVLQVLLRFSYLSEVAGHCLWS